MQQCMQARDMKAVMREAAIVVQLLCPKDRVHGSQMLLQVVPPAQCSLCTVVDCGWQVCSRP